MSMLESFEKMSEQVFAKEIKLDCMTEQEKVAFHENDFLSLRELLASDDKFSDTNYIALFADTNWVVS